MSRHLDSFYRLAVPAFLSCCLAQSPKPIQVTSAVETGYAGVFNASLRGPSMNLGFLQDTGSLRLTEATLGIQGDWNRIGFHIEGGAGDLYRLSMASDSWKGPNQYIAQAYITGKPFAALPIRIEAGKFYSSVGAEVPHGYQNFNSSRSLLFWFGSPLYHLGVRATIPVTTSWTVGAQVLSGSNTMTGSHGHQSMAFTGTWTGKRWGFAQTYLGGNQKAQGSGWRQLSDSILTVNLTPKIHGYVEMLAATEKRVGTGYDRWYGGATAWKYSPLEKWSISPRLEWYDDATGATTGMRQRLAEFTLTGEYRPAKIIIARLEYRNDWSSMPFYANALDGRPATRQHSLLAGITMLLQHGL